MLKQSFILFLLLAIFASCSGNEATVQSIGFDEPSREELKSAMHYHGVAFAEQAEDGQWYFYRDGKRCRLFAYLEVAE